MRTSRSTYLSEDFAKIMKYNPARGGSAVVDPNGRYLAGPVLDEEKLIVADCRRSDRVLAKPHLDTVGHSVGGTC